MAQQQSPIPVSPFLDRPGLDPAPQPEPNLHLSGGIWIASCPTCMYQLATARTQQRCSGEPPSGDARSATWTRPDGWIEGGSRFRCAGAVGLLQAKQPSAQGALRTSTQIASCQVWESSDVDGSQAVAPQGRRGSACCTTRSIA
jgi:hypothetical protein